MGTGEFDAGGNPAMDSCYRNRDKLWPDGPLGSYADLTLPYMYSKHEVVITS